MDTIVAALGSAWMQDFMNDHAWFWPFCETLHFMGMVLLMGTVGLFDLRLLGLAQGLPAAAFNRLIPWGLFGFAVNGVTGLLFVAGNQFAVEEYARNPAFQWKLALMLVAGGNAAVFYVSGLSRRVEALSPGQNAPVAGKVIAAASLSLWTGVIAFGRLLPYLGDAF